MLQLAYMSIATDGLASDSTAKICLDAQIRNRADEITGVLLGNGQRFLQVLEGPKETVENTFLRVMIDPRHRTLLLLSRRLVTVREFGMWDMADCNTKTSRAKVISQVRQLAAKGPETVYREFELRYPN